VILPPTSSALCTCLRISLKHMRVSKSSATLQSSLFCRTHSPPLYPLIAYSLFLLFYFHPQFSVQCSHERWQVWLCWSFWLCGYANLCSHYR
jgi:hypothetical protein